MLPTLARPYPEFNLTLTLSLTLRQVRFLVLKNLAAALAAEDGTAAQALGLYGQAALLDGGDIVLWNRMGTLVCGPTLNSGSTNANQKH